MIQLACQLDFSQLSLLAQKSWLKWFTFSSERKLMMSATVLGAAWGTCSKDYIASECDLKLLVLGSVITNGPVQIYHLNTNHKMVPPKVMEVFVKDVFPFLKRFSLSQWSTFKLLGTTCFIRKYHSSHNHGSGKWVYLHSNISFLPLPWLWHGTKGINLSFRFMVRNGGLSLRFPVAPPPALVPKGVWNSRQVFHHVRFRFRGSWEIAIRWDCFLFVCCIYSQLKSHFEFKLKVEKYTWY